MKKSREFFIHLAVFAALNLICDLCYGVETTDTQGKKIESVLDKLEKRLIDREASPFTEDEDLAIKSPKSKKDSPAKEYYQPKTPGKIKGNTASGKNLQEVQKKINEYDSRIEILESDLRRLRAGVYEGSVTDNQVMLDVKTSKDAKYIIRTLTTKLDGNTLYNQLDPAGLWMPSREVPVFYGPLQPGDHRVDISATIAPLSPEGLEIPTWQHKSLQQSFSFNIPDGKIRKTVTIEIAEPKTSGSHPVAKMTEADTK